jgi:nitronate monooxygenase
MVNPQPQIIQGGMGVAVSSPQLARAVSELGQMGVVSGTALDLVLARRLQLGDADGDIRRAMAAFPDQDLAGRVLSAYFVEGGKPEKKAFKSVPMYSVDAKRRSHELAVLGGFVEVWLAKEGHDGVVGINFLEKLQLPTSGILYGSMLAGVDYVLVGAGIPREIPGLIDRLTRHETAGLKIRTLGDQGPVEQVFEPTDVLGVTLPELPRPKFLAIIASATLAVSLARKTPGVDGFIVEGPTAGGHNAPPRGTLTLDADGQPIYGPRDEVDMAKMREVGLPFWLAGGQATPEGLRDALSQGAAGIQVGTIFAFCEESGMDSGIRQRLLAKSREGSASIFTDPLASPTGFPFKVAQLEETLSEDAVVEGRDRRCDLGYLRDPYHKEDGTLGYRCPAEPVDDYLRKGGKIEDTVGRKCICNGLLSTIGLGQWRHDYAEPPIVTAGDDLARVGGLLPERESYSAADVVSYLLGESSS